MALTSVLAAHTASKVASNTPAINSIRAKPCCTRLAIVPSTCGENEGVHITLGTPGFRRQSAVMDAVVLYRCSRLAFSGDRYGVGYPLHDRRNGRTRGIVNLGQGDGERRSRFLFGDADLPIGAQAVQHLQRGLRARSRKYAGVAHQMGEVGRVNPDVRRSGPIGRIDLGLQNE